MSRDRDYPLTNSNFFKGIQNSRWTSIASAACIFFGCLLLLLTISAADGVWFFYAKNYLTGIKLYSDQQLVQQPLFIIFNAIGIFIFGDSFIAQKFIFIPILIAYVLLIKAIVKHTKTSDHIQAVLIVSIFFISIYFPPFRFDDYHAFAYTLELLFLWILLQVFPYRENTKKYYFFILGIVLAFIIFTKITDGILLLAGYLFINFLNRNRIHPHQLALFILGIIFGTGLIYLMAQDNVRAWYLSTLVDASGVKGGSQMWKFVPKLLQNAWENAFALPNLLFFGMLSICIFLYTKYRRLLLLALSALLFFIVMKTSIPIYYWINLIILALFIYSAFFIIFSQKKNGLIVFNSAVTQFPILISCLLMAGALSSAGSTTDFTFILSISLIVFIGIADAHHLQRLKFFLVIITLFLGFSALIHKFNTPYAWHDYRVPRINQNRDLISTNSLGPLLIDKKLNQFIEPICKKIQQNNNQQTLLSIPFPFANYFCGISLWRNYVQLFFDFSNKKLVNDLVFQLSHNPPDYVFYQRQLKSLEHHERIFNSGQPLPHRALDALIMGRIESGLWQVIFYEQFGDGDWLFIATK